MVFLSLEDGAGFPALILFDRKGAARTPPLKP